MEIAWIHEQTASDGWSDTVRDFYNNRQGIALGKEIEKELGDDFLLLVRSQGTEDSGKWRPDLVNPTIMPTARYEAAVQEALRLAEKKALEAAKAGKLLLDPRLAMQPKYLNPVIREVQRFWDADVDYASCPGPDQEAASAAPSLR